MTLGPTKEGESAEVQDGAATLWSSAGGVTGPAGYFEGGQCS
jgi:hypothetical protein